MSYTNSQLAHVWAQQNEISGSTSNGNFSFRGASLYSYRTEIARFYGREICVATRHKYSVTTTGKHANQISRAVGGHLYTVREEMRNVPGVWEEARIIVQRNMAVDIQEILDSLRRARVYCSGSIDQLIDAFNLYSTFSFSWSLSDVLGSELANKLYEITASRELEGNDLGNVVLRTHFLDLGVDLLKLAENSRKTEEKRAAKRAEEMRITALNAEEKIAEWLSGKNISIPWNCPVYLRLNGAEIETSKGARVPYVEAVKLWDLVRTGENVAGFRVGHFTVNRIENENIVIGCHTIPLSEFNRMAVLLGLSDNENATN